MGKAVEGVSTVLPSLLMVKADALSVLLPPSMLVANQTTESVPSETPTRARRQEEYIHQATRDRVSQGRLSSLSLATLLLWVEGDRAGERQ
jgi:hypothetical protein